MTTVKIKNPSHTQTTSTSVGIDPTSLAGGSDRRAFAYSVTPFPTIHPVISIADLPSVTSRSEHAVWVIDALRNGTFLFPVRGGGGGARILSYTMSREMQRKPLV